MRKTLILILTVFLAVVLTYGFAYALQGPCVNCHTMHNSQDGNPMNFDGSGIPNQLLLRGTCAGCHAQNTGDAIVDGAIPQVLHTNTTDLAGGNFHYGDSVANQVKIHNVADLPAPYGSQDTVLLNNPPGYLSGYDPALTDFDTNNRLRCAGQNGCHGNRDQSDEFAAIKGGHHFTDTMLKFPPDGTINESLQGGGTGGTSDITTTGKSYRFLYNVHGGEDINWQYTSSTTDHNEYKGAIFDTRGQTQTWASITTISDLCAECHGKFHAGGLTSDSGIGSSSPWLRHPTDAILPGTGEYASISTTYNLDTPVARQTIPASPGGTITISGGSADIVMCLSCHRAHGSDYADILRWDYNTSLAVGEGCLVCHTQKSAY